VSALVVTGFSIHRALLAIVASSVAVCALLASWLPPRGFRPTAATILDISRFAGPMALCLIAGQILVNLDLWALKSLWTGDGDVIGEYVSALNLSRTLAVIPTVQAGVLFSSVAWAFASGDKARAVRHIQEASRFALVIAAAACVILGMNGRDVLSVLFSSAYADGQRFLPFQLVAFGLFALLDVYANALMATGRHRLVAAVLTATVPIVWFANYVMIARMGPIGAAIALALGIGVALVVTGALAGWQFGALIRLSTVLRVTAAATVVGLASGAIHMPGRWVLAKLALLGGMYLFTLYVLREVTPEDLGLKSRSAAPGGSRT
jgi:O-antigen/teichoic acid export membrane protein